MRITDQVIEEVDENLTIHSNRQEKRPTVQGLFKNSVEKLPKKSEPIDVPSPAYDNDRISYERVQSVNPDHQPYLFPANAIFSSSAPEENSVHFGGKHPKIQIENTTDKQTPASGGTGGSQSFLIQN